MQATVKEIFDAAAAFGTLRSTAAMPATKALEIKSAKKYFKAKADELGEIAEDIIKEYGGMVAERGQIVLPEYVAAETPYFGTEECAGKPVGKLAERTEIVSGTTRIVVDGEERFVRGGDVRNDVKAFEKRWQEFYAEVVELEPPKCDLSGVLGNISTTVEALESLERFAAVE